MACSSTGPDFVEDARYHRHSPQYIIRTSFAPSLSKGAKDETICAKWEVHCVMRMRESRMIRSNAKHVVIIAALGFLAACGQSERAQQDLSAQENLTILNRGNSAEPRSLDPHYAQAQYESTIVGDLLMGLTIDGPDAISIPAAAEIYFVPVTVDFDVDPATEVRVHLHNHGGNSWRIGHLKRLP